MVIFYFFTLKYFVDSPQVSSDGTFKYGSNALFLMGSQWNQEDNNFEP